MKGANSLIIIYFILYIYICDVEGQRWEQEIRQFFTVGSQLKIELPSFKPHSMSHIAELSPAERWTSTKRGNPACQGAALFLIYVLPCFFKTKLIVIAKQIQP